MASFRFLHAADIHLDSPLRGLSRYEGLPADRLRHATREAFDNLIRTALTESVNFVVIAGDLFDGDWKDMGTGLYFARSMGRLVEAGIPVFLLKGNHDAESAVTKNLPLPDMVNVFSSREAQTFALPEFGVVLHGRSFPTVHVREDLTEAYPMAVTGAFNIGVLHTAMGGYAQHETYAPCSVAGLTAKGYDYWALGHVHERQVLSEDPWIVFPGNLQGRHAREVGAKGASLVEVDDGRVTAVRHVPLDTIRWLQIRVECNDAVDVDDVHGRIRAAFTQAWANAANRAVVARVTLTGTTSVAGLLSDRGSLLREEVRAIAAHVGDDLWIEKVRVQTVAPLEAITGLSEDAATMLDEVLGDEELEVLLAEDLKPFLDALPADIGERETLIWAARDKRWSELIMAASGALSERLATGGT
jgi:exonuclease SbcD